MSTLRKLPSRLKTCVYELSRLRAALCTLEEQLALARHGVMACDGAPRKELLPISEHLDAAVAHMKTLVNARGENAQALAQAHFAKVGVAEGAVITLTYPVYGLRLAAAFDEERLPRKLKQATLKVEGFTVEHVRGKTEVVLGVSGRVVQDGKASKESAAFCLHPGCAVEVVQPAPAKEVLRLPAPDDAAGLPPA
jgi:hypothetical protein